MYDLGVPHGPPILGNIHFLFKVGLHRLVPRRKIIIQIMTNGKGYQENDDITKTVNSFRFTSGPKITQQLYKSL